MRSIRTAQRKVLRFSRDKSSARERVAILRRRDIQIDKTLQDRFGASRYAQGTLEFRIYPVWLSLRNARAPDFPINHRALVRRQR